MCRCGESHRVEFGEENKLVSRGLTYEFLFLTMVAVFYKSEAASLGVDSRVCFSDRGMQYYLLQL